MSPSEYGKLHGLTVAYVWRLIRAGRLPCERVNGKLRYRITGDVQRLKPGRKANAAPDSQDQIP